MWEEKKRKAEDRRRTKKVDHFNGLYHDYVTPRRSETRNSRLRGGRGRRVYNDLCIVSVVRLSIRHSSTTHNAVIPRRRRLRSECEPFGGDDEAGGGRPEFVACELEVSGEREE
jgi:hypothetical protein